jgi:hypothetical protein
MQDNASDHRARATLRNYEHEVCPLFFLACQLDRSESNREVVGLDKNYIQEKYP